MIIIQNQLFITFGFIALDIVTGVTIAIKNKELVSSRLRDGLFKKIGIILTLCFTILIDKTNIITVPTFTFTSLYIIFMECVSIKENIKKLNKNAIPKELDDLIEKKGDI